MFNEVKAEGYIYIVRLLNFAFKCRTLSVVHNKKIISSGLSEIQKRWQPAACCCFISMAASNSNSLSGKLSFISEGGEEISSLAHFLCTLGMLFPVSPGCGERHCAVAGTSGFSSFLFPSLVIRK